MRIECDGFGKQLPCPRIGFLRSVRMAIEPAQVVVIGLDIVGERPPQTRLLACREFYFEGRDDFPRYFVLQGKNVLQVPIIAVSPHVIAGGGVYELRRNTYPLACFADTAFQDVPHPEFLADLFGFDCFAFIQIDRVTGDDKKT